MLRLHIARPRPVRRPPPGSGRVWGDENGREIAYGERCDDGPWIHIPGVASYELGEDGPEVVAHPEPGVAPERVEAIFRKPVLPFALHVRGWEVLHASAVETREGILAFAGLTWSGKSTFAHALSVRGYPHWSDDALALRIGEEEVDAVWMPFTPRLRGNAARAARRRGPAVAVDPPSGEHDFRLSLRNIYLLRRGATETVSVRPLGAGDVVAMLVMNAFCFDPGDEARQRRMMESYLHLAHRVGVASLRYPDGFDRLDAVLDRVEEMLDLRPPVSGADLPQADPLEEPA